MRRFSCLEIIQTKNDKKYHRDLWASFFKAKEWGELMELAKQDQNIQKAVVTLKKLTEDEKFKLQYEAREDRIRQELDMKYYYENKFAEQAKELAEQKKENSAKDKQIVEQNQYIEQLQKQIKELQQNQK